MLKVKKSYIIMYIYYAVLIFLLFLNSFVYNFLKGNTVLLFVLISLLIFSFLLNIEKDRHRYSKDILFEVFIILLLFFLLYYLSGVLIGFYKNTEYYSFLGLRKFIIPTAINCIATEILRYATLKKSEENKKLIIINCIFFIMLELTNTIYVAPLNNKYSIFILIAVNILPTITKNIMASYIALNFGYKPNIAYSLIMSLYSYLLPIIPNYSKYIYSMVMLILPVLIIVRINKIVEKIKDKEISRDYKKKTIIGYIIPIIIVSVLVYFTSGYFKYYVVAIASGSMSGTIEKGDIVVINQLKNIEDYAELSEGQIIAYKHDGNVIVHRLIRIANNKEEIYYYTKGDANENEDNYPIDEKDIIGIVKAKIPYLGYPTVWLSEI